MGASIVLPFKAANPTRTSITQLMLSFSPCRSGESKRCLSRRMPRPRLIFNLDCRALWLPSGARPLLPAKAPHALRRLIGHSPITRLESAPRPTRNDADWQGVAAGRWTYAPVASDPKDATPGFGLSEEEGQSN